MALCYITEYQGAAQVHGGLAAPQEPAPIDQNPIVIGAGHQESAPFASSTRLIRIHVDAICSIAIGAAPVATTSNQRLAANQTEYKGVLPGHVLSVVANV